MKNLSNSIPFSMGTSICTFRTKIMYVQNQDMYLQNQDMYRPSEPNHIPLFKIKLYDIKYNNSAFHIVRKSLKIVDIN